MISLIGFISLNSFSLFYVFFLIHKRFMVCLRYIQTKIFEGMSLSFTYSKCISNMIDYVLKYFYSGSTKSSKCADRIPCRVFFMPIEYHIIIFTLNTPRCKQIFFTPRYHSFSTSHNPYTLVFSSHDFLVLASFGGLRNIYLSINFPCKKADLISIVSILLLHKGASAKKS